MNLIGQRLATNPVSKHDIPHQLRRQLTDVEVRYRHRKYRLKLIVPTSLSLTGHHLGGIVRHPLFEWRRIDVLHLKDEVMVPEGSLFILRLRIRIER